MKLCIEESDNGHDWYTIEERKIIGPLPPIQPEELLPLYRTYRRFCLIPRTEASIRFTSAVVQKPKRER